ncbi:MULTISPECIES: EF-hand domain-containing protein [Hyphobacterium]|uniref:EF-hand domain-containing protein n=1 Tax=Hyphobacterium vulgare TaxID=1736751 RepID=A0ABV7A0G0_9PROT
MRVVSILAAASAVALASCSTSAGRNPDAPTLTASPDQQIAPPVGLMLAGLDSDHDAIVSGDEFAAAVPVMFSRSDADGDGHLNGVEFSDWSERNLGATHTIPGRMTFDHDQNGLISQSEFEATLAGVVSRFDQDRDGALQRSELLVTMVGPDIAAIRGDMEEQMRRRARQMCQQAARR